jgi:hypothetical protein
MYCHFFPFWLEKFMKQQHNKLYLNSWTKIKERKMSSSFELSWKKEKKTQTKYLIDVSLTFREVLYKTF